MIFGKPWSKEEIKILEENDAYSDLGVVAALGAADFDRSVAAVRRKRQRLEKDPSSIYYIQVVNPEKFAQPTYEYYPSSISLSSETIINSPHQIVTIPQWISGALPLDKSKPTKFVMLNDVHVPDNIPLDNVFRFIEDYKPDYMLLVGDIVNNDPFSHWDRNSPMRFKHMPEPKAYYEDCNKTFYDPLRKAVGSTCKLVHWIGNHEFWSNKAIGEMPEGKGYWEVENNIRNVDLWVESKGIANLGKLHFIHGDILKGGANLTKRMVQLFHRNIRFGHAHHLEEASQTNPLDVKDMHTARCCGTLQNINPHYMKGMPTNWINCFTYGVVFPSGNFFDHTTVITNNSFLANGKVYGKIT